MRKMKTKAELKSVGDYFKIGALPSLPSGGRDLTMLPLPLTCGLCYKVNQRTPRQFLESFIFYF